jgi:death-on-curing protein
VKWLEVPVVLAIHDAQLAEHGGADGVRDADLLEAALARPQNLASYDKAADIAALAARLAHGLARNHPFIDGNKRTSAVATETFLNLNGFDLAAEDAEILETWFALAAAALGEAELAAWIRTRLKRRQSGARS